MLVFNNRGYGGLKYLQDQSGVRHVAVDLHTPNFTALGTAMGLESRHAGDLAEFERAFAAAMAVDGPNLIEVDITGMAPLQM